MVGFHTPTLKVEIREGAQTEYGTPVPVVIVELDERLTGRLQDAFMFRLAAEVSMFSLEEAWGIHPGRFSLMGKGNPHRAILKLELADGTMEEAERGAAVLRRAVANLKKNNEALVRLVFTGK